MPKRSSHDAFQAVMPAAQRADSGTGAGVRSRSGRVVKPKVRRQTARWGRPAWGAPPCMLAPLP